MSSATGIRVTDVRIPVPDGTQLPAALALPSDAGRSRAVVVLHEALGLNDDIRGIAARFAEDGYVALAPDFLAGLGPKPLCIARFFRGVGRSATGRPYRQLDAARDWLAGRPDVDAAGVGVAGFCIGGGFALLWAASAGAEAVRVAAPFYAPVPRDAAGELQGICPVVASYGGRDRFFREMPERLEEALTSIGVDHDVRVYPEAGHSFANRHGGPLAWLGRRLPMHAGWHPASAEDAWARTLDFFDRHLGRSAA